jgi:lipopolysaccharide transport system ATP-binding protein
VLGFSKKEIDAKFDAIVEFADIDDFIDTPVQNYSSGMKVRLGFAVAAQMEPDVLVDR